MGANVTSPFFLAQRIGRWRWRWLPLGLIASLVGAVSFGVLLILAAVLIDLIAPSAGLGDTISEVVESEELQVFASPPMLALEFLFVGGLFWFAAMGGTIAHGRPLRSLLVPVERFRWPIVAKVLGLSVLLWCGLSLLGVVLFPDGPAVSFQGVGMEHVIWLIPMSVVILIQTSGEDVFFKGLLLRQIGAATGVTWFAPLVVVAVFVALHVGNPDLQQNLLLVLSLFAVSDLVIVYLVMRTGGLEAALVLHWVNNASITFLVAEEGTQANDLTLFVTEQLADDAALDNDIIDATFFSAYLLLLLVGLLWHRSPFVVERWEPSTESITSTPSAH